MELIATVNGEDKVLVRDFEREDFSMKADGIMVYKDDIAVAFIPYDRNPAVIEDTIED